jgi:hypothetical protein
VSIEEEKKQRREKEKKERKKKNKTGTVCAPVQPEPVRWCDRLMCAGATGSAA